MRPMQPEPGCLGLSLYLALTAAACIVATAVALTAADDGRLALPAAEVATAAFFAGRLASSPAVLPSADKAGAVVPAMPSLLALAALLLAIADIATAPTPASEAQLAAACLNGEEPRV